MGFKIEYPTDTDPRFKPLANIPMSSKNRVLLTELYKVICRNILENIVDIDYCIGIFYKLTMIYPNLRFEKMDIDILVNYKREFLGLVKVEPNTGHIWVQKTCYFSCLTPKGSPLSGDQIVSLPDLMEKLMFSNNRDQVELIEKMTLELS